MKEIVSNPAMVAHCGLYCGACRRYLKDGCPGCHETEKAGWCKVRQCCISNSYGSCADCREYTDPMECAKFNNIMAKIFGFVFRSDRAACISQIRRIGIEAHAEEMAKQRRHSIPR